MMFLSKFSLKNPVAVIILALLIILGGIYSAGKFKQESMPDISIPYLFVTAVFPGATPQEVQQVAAIPLENALKQISGVEALESISANSVVTLSLQFGFGADMDRKMDELEKALAAVDLPPQVERPRVSKISLESGPMIYASVSAKDRNKDGRELSEWVNQQLLPSLTGIEGIGKVLTSGLLSDDIFIRLDAGKMAEKGVSYQQVDQVLQAMNVSIPLGEANVDQVLQPVMITGKLQTIDQLRDLVVHPNPLIRLGDISEIKQGADVPETITRIQGNPAVAVNIIKNNDANTVELSKRVAEVFAQAGDAGSPYQIDVIFDSADSIERSVSGLVREGLLGALFASLMILLFLRNLRATLIAIVSIPLSILLALAFLKAFTDITLNIMTLGGMAVAVGRVVDDSIVVIENIVRRMQREPATRELIYDAAKEVGGAITSSTITTVAVFAPLGLVSGLIGKVFAPFALTVVCSLLASLLVAVTVVPMLAFLLMRGKKPTREREGAAARKYKTFLNFLLNHKAMALLLGAVIFAGSLLLIPYAGFTFLPEQKEKFITMTLTMPEGTPVNIVDEKAQELDGKLRDTGYVLKSQVSSGLPKGEFDPLTFTPGASNKANWIVGLDADLDIPEFIKGLKVRLDPGVEGASLDINEVTIGPGGPGVYIVVTGNAKEAIAAAADQITAAVEAVPGTDHIQNTLLEETTSVEIRVRPEDALKYGLTTAQAAQWLRPIFVNEQIGRLGTGPQTNDVYLNVSHTDTGSIAAIQNLPLTSITGQPLTVKQIADVRLVKQPRLLQLRNGQDYAVVTGNITDKDAGKVNQNITAALKSLKLPEGTNYVIDGSNKQIQDMVSDMSVAMLVAIGLVYVVMIIAFGQARAPFAILFSLPFAVIGALLGTIVAGQPISVASLIGVLMLIGIVVTNAIVFIDRVQQQLNKGHTIRTSLLEAGGTRLRPILMTAIATIFALLPLALGLGEGELISTGLAVVVIGGLITATLMTLVIVPIMYELLYYRKSRKQRRWEPRRKALETGLAQDGESI